MDDAIAEDPEELPEAEPERPVDRAVAVGVAATAFVLGVVVLVVRRHDHFGAVQQCFVLAGLAMLGLWLSSALVETDRGREIARSSMIGVVGGVAVVGFIGLAVLLVS